MSSAGRRPFHFHADPGALCWSTGNALWAQGATVHAVVPWWLAFLILTIAGERLELSRFLPPSPFARRAFAAILAAASPDCWAWRPVGRAGVRRGPARVGALARQTGHRAAHRARQGPHALHRGVPALGLRWLALGGAVIVAAGGLAPGSPAYDAALHALLLGFVFAMVFGHAPIIFPAVLRVAVPYHPTFYLPLAVLHLSLVVRLAGDATAQFEWIRVGGALNALALVAFIASTASAVARGRRRPPSAAECRRSLAVTATSRSSPRGTRSCRARR